MNKRTFFIAACLLVLAGVACQVFNESCPVTTPEVWGRGLSVDLDIREEFVRQCEAPVGNFLADALRLFPYGLTDDGNPVTVRLGLINAGAIRDEVVCGEAGSRRDRIPQGPITDQDIFQLLPFYEDSVVVVRMTGAQIERVLERSVSSLTLSGEEGQEGHFLHVSGQQGVQVDVNCAGAAQTLADGGKAVGTAGDRIVAVCLGQSCTPLDPTAVVYVATLDFLVGKDDQEVPNDGFVGFHFADVGEEAPKVLQTYLPVIDVVRYWLVNYEDGLELEYGSQLASEILEAGYPAAEGRLQYSACDALEGVCGPAS